MEQVLRVTAPGPGEAAVRMLIHDCNRIELNRGSAPMWATAVWGTKPAAQGPDPPRDSAALWKARASRALSAHRWIN